MINREECSRKAEKLRAYFGKSNLEPVDPFSVASQVPKLTIVLYPFSDALSGLCVRADRYRLIAVNSRHTLGRQNFTLAHELHHLFFDEQMQSVICPAGGSKDPIEQTADCFASRFLLPDAALERWCRSEVPSACVGQFATPSFRGLSDGEVLEALLAMERRFGLSRNASLVRLAEAGVLDQARADAFKRNVKRSARERGYSLAIYEPRRGVDAKWVSGDYIELVALLLSESKISDSLATQLLADGFREDISIIELEAEDDEF